MLSTLQNLSFSIDHVQNVAIESHGDVIGHHVTIFDKNGEAIGGGCCESKLTALRIATAEVIERAIFQKMSNSSAGFEFFLQSFPTTCGFAAGFDPQKTLGRSELEAYERWAWSKWIDEQLHIPRVSTESQTLTPLSQYFFESFDEVYFHKLILKKKTAPLYLGITLGLKDGGIFPGSRMAASESEIWQHSLLESWRHYISFIHMKKYRKESSSFVDGRIQFFGSNAKAALDQIPMQSESEWPQPKIALQRLFQIPDKEVFLARTLCEDFVGWHEGGITRFVY